MRVILPRAAKTKTREAPAPEPVLPPKRSRIDVPILDAQTAKDFKKSFVREMRKKVALAVQNTESATTWSFDLAFNGKTQADDTGSFDWHDDLPRRLLSADGVPILYHIPNGLSKKSADILLEQLLRFAETLGVKLPKVAGADGEGRGKVKSYHDILGQVAGIFKLVKAWHAIGHSHEDPVVSSQIIQSGHSFSCSLDLITQLHLISNRINALLEFADPAHYEALGRLRTKAEELHKFYQVIGSDDPLLMEGREIMYNRQTPDHRDMQDPKKGWAALVVVGPFVGGSMRIVGVNGRIRYTHGDMVLIRGRLLKHGIEDFSGGQRVCIAHFTHDALWRECGITPP